MLAAAGAGSRRQAPCAPGQPACEGTWSSSLSPSSCCLRPARRSANSPSSASATAAAGSSAAIGRQRALRHGKRGLADGVPERVQAPPKHTSSGWTTHQQPRRTHGSAGLALPRRLWARQPASQPASQPARAAAASRPCVQYGSRTSLLGLAKAVIVAAAAAAAGRRRLRRWRGAASSRKNALGCRCFKLDRSRVRWG